MSQVAGLVPSAQPLPWQTEHSVAVSTARSLATPVAHSSSVSSIGISASSPCRTRDRGPRDATAAAATEEGVHDVAEAHPAERVAHAAGRTAAGLAAAAQRVTAEVDDLTLRRVGQHLVGRRDLFELLLGSRIRVDVGMQLPRQFAVGPLDLVRRRALGHAEQAVIVPCHPLHQLPFLRVWPAQRSLSGLAP